MTLLTKQNKYMESLAKGLGAVMLGLLSIFAICVLSGTILWAIYPHIHALFPTAAQNGIIAKDLGWWDSVAVTWIFSILFGRGTSKSSSKSKED